MKADLPALLAAGAVTPVWRALAYHEDSATPLELDVERVELSFDETRAPRCQLRLDARTPDDLGLTGLLDPRAPVRIVLHAGHRWPDGTVDSELVADVGLRARRLRSPGQLMELDACGDEALILDASTVLGGAGGVTAASTTAAITALLATAGGPGGTPVVNVTSSAGPAVSIPAASNLDRWETIEDLKDQLGDVDVFDDGTRTWWVSPIPTTPAVTPDLHLTYGPGGLLLEVTDELGREDWANYVYLRYAWTPSGGSPTVVAGVASITTGPIRGQNGNYKYSNELRNKPATTPTANAAAASVLRRKASHGRKVTVRAVAVPWLRPGHTVSLSLPTGDSLTALVSAVTFSDRGWMDIVTRLPTTETIA